MPDHEPYDALLLVSFGGPEKPDDVVPFLRNVTAGRGHPRLASRGGRRALLRVRRPQPDQRPEPRPGRRDQGRPVGQRHRPAGLLGQPQLGPLPARGDRADEGRRGDPRRCPPDQRVLVLQRLPPVPREPRRRRGRGARGAADRPAAALLQPPGLRRVDGRRDPRRPGGAARGRPPRRPPRLRHALDPDRDERQQRSARRRLRRPAPAGRSPRSSSGCGRRPGTAIPSALVYCSRSGPPQVPWLEPDVNDHLRALKDKGVPGVVVVPIGFVSDHMEVIYDLDTEARATAEEIGLPFARAATAGVDPRFVAMVRDLLLERGAAERGEPTRTRGGRVGRRPGTSVRRGAAPTRERPAPGTVRRGLSGDRHRRRPAGPGPRDRPRGRPSSSWRCASRGVDVAETKSSPIDVVTEADRACEELIRERLLGARPDDGFSARRATTSRARRGSAGSSTRSTGRSTTSTGCRTTPSRSRPRARTRSWPGWCSAPSLGLEYAATLGAGATCNGVPLQVRPTPALEQSLIATGFGYETEVRERQAHVGGPDAAAGARHPAPGVLRPRPVRRGRRAAGRLRRGGPAHLGLRRGRPGRASRPGRPWRSGPRWSGTTSWCAPRRPVGPISPMLVRACGFVGDGS